MATNTITVQPNQSMQDVIIQATGSMEAGMQFCMDNNINISDTPVVGIVCSISAAAQAMGNTGNLQYLQQYAVTLGTLGDVPPVLMTSEDSSETLHSEDDSEIFVSEDAHM